MTNSYFSMQNYIYSFSFLKKKKALTITKKMNKSSCQTGSHDMVSVTLLKMYTIFSYSSKMNQKLQTSSEKERI